ncbi:hypothetical protein DPEC_G00249480, partial [Dallia pectoralis]
MASVGICLFCRNLLAVSVWVSNPRGDVSWIGAGMTFIILCCHCQCLCSQVQYAFKNSYLKLRLGGTLPFRVHTYSGWGVHYLLGSIHSLRLGVHYLLGSIHSLRLGGTLPFRVHTFTQVGGTLPFRVHTFTQVGGTLPFRVHTFTQVGGTLPFRVHTFTQVGGTLPF